MQSDLFYWHFLNSLSGMGSRSLHKLMQAFSAPRDIFNCDTAALQQLGLRQALVEQLVKHARLGESGERFELAAASWEKMQRQQIQLMSWRCADYPPYLAAIPDPPAILYLKGKRAVLNEPQVAIVGSRCASHDGIAHATSFARALAESGITVTSGMALGIDGAAHQGALAGGGETCAVLGCGVDVVYPAQHRHLAEQIMAQGIVVSEYLPGTQPKAAYFPRRNRIISALTYGVLVVEAAPNSGSLITARLAMEYNREVFAIPGSINNPQARGCHRLIRDGAVLTQTVADILTELSAVLPVYSAPSQHTVTTLPPLPTELASVIEAMGFDVVTVDVLSERLALPVQHVLGCMVELELLDCVIATPGGYQRRS